jgi:hypothetical protein
VTGRQLKKKTKEKKKKKVTVKQIDSSNAYIENIGKEKLDFQN